MKEDREKGVAMMLRGGRNTSAGLTEQGDR